MTSHPGVTGRKVFADSALYSDAQILLAINLSPASLRNWRLTRGFPPGVLIGPHTRRTPGADLNDWYAANARDAKVPLPAGMGKSHKGRPRKQPTTAEAGSP